MLRVFDKPTVNKVTITMLLERVVPLLYRVPSAPPYNSWVEAFSDHCNSSTKSHNWISQKMQKQLQVNAKTLMSLAGGVCRVVCLWLAFTLWFCRVWFWCLAACLLFSIFIFRVLFASWILCFTISLQLKCSLKKLKIRVRILFFTRLQC